MSRTNASGFSIIEVLIAVAILSISTIAMLASGESGMKAQATVTARGDIEQIHQSLFIAARSTDLCAGMVKLGGGAIQYTGLSSVSIHSISVNSHTLVQSGESISGGFIVSEIVLERATTTLSSAPPNSRFLSELRVTSKRTTDQSFGQASFSRSVLLEVITNSATGQITSCSASNYASSSGVSMIQVSMDAEVSFSAPEVAGGCYRGFAPDYGLLPGPTPSPCLVPGEYNSNPDGPPVKTWISQQLELTTCSIPQNRVLTKGIRADSGTPSPTANPGYVWCGPVQSGVGSAWRLGYPTPNGIPSRDDGSYGITGPGAGPTPAPSPAPPYTPLVENSIAWDQCQITLMHNVSIENPSPENLSPPIPQPAPSPNPSPLEEWQSWKSAAAGSGGNCSVHRNPDGRWILQASMRGKADIRCRARCTKFVLN